jgi:anion-transporting  ArsA/GET3 family ATPase
MATASRPEPAASASLDQLLAAKEIVVACGAGGVGKTTAAAAAATMAAVRHGGKVLVLTVDPARRLADALGLGAEQRRVRAGEAAPGIGNVERRVPDEAFERAGVKPRGELWAAMLDTKASWDDLVRRHAPDPSTAEQILANPLYKNVSGRFVQSHEYIAVERLYEIHGEGDYDLIVVDTPPTRNAVDFLEAPARMAEFFSSRLLRWLIVPYRSRLVNLASRPFYQVADRILGTQFLEDIAEFFLLFQTMYDGFVERARAVSRLLHDRRTTFMVVSTLEAVPLREAQSFMTELSDSGYHLGAVVLNRVLPEYLRQPGATVIAERIIAESDRLADSLAPASGERDQVRRVLVEIAESYLNFQVVARREAEQEAELSAAPEVVATVPFFETDIYDLAGLVRLGESMWSRRPVAGPPSEGETSWTS